MSDDDNDDDVPNIQSRLPHAFRRLAELLRPRLDEPMNDALPHDDEEPRTLQ